MSKITTIDPVKNREVVVGELKDKIFYKTVTKKHYFWKYKGYAIQKSVLKHILDNKCKEIHINAPMGIYSSIIEKWVGSGAITINGKHGCQQVLPIAEMELTERMFKKEDIKKAMGVKGKKPIKPRQFKGQIEEQEIDVDADTKETSKENTPEEEVV